jgi:hypothetical protein
VTGTLATAKALEEKLATLAENRVFVPKEGYEQLRSEAIAEAQGLAETAQRNFERNFAEAKEALTVSAIPRLESDSREGLARDEFRVALGDAQGNDVGSRLFGLARHGSAEVQAILGTSYARTELISRGTANVDRLLADARLIVAAEAQTPEAVKAREGLDRLGKLGAAQAAAASAFRHSGPQF